VRAVYGGSLSPHRVLPPADENLDGVVSTREAQRQQDFTGIILDNLRKAGVQNTVKNERLKFDRLDPFPGQWLQAAGEYTDVHGKVKRVAVSIGPEHGTVGPVQVKEAAKEAVKGVGLDVLIVCGFAFDPHVTEEAKRYGKLVVLPARMNPDLAMGDELLKKTGAGNLFTVFGEPDIEVRKTKDKQIEVEIKGVDVYDPTTGQVRSSTTDDLAAGLWTRITTASHSSCGKRISSARMSRMKNSSVPSAPMWTKRPGARFIAPSRAPSQTLHRQNRCQSNQPLWR